MAEKAQRPVALITGGSSGIGETFARHLAKGGHDIVLVARRRDRMEQLASELSEQLGAGTEVLEADLSTDEGLAAVEERVRKGDIDLLINCAGFGTRGQFVELPLEREMEEINVNVRALTRLTHAALETMVPKKNGGIINVASTAAFQPVPNMATYAGTKAYVLYFTEAVHEEAKKHGVKVTCLCPGPVRTEFQQVANVRDDHVPSLIWTSPDSVVKAALKALRTGRASVVPGIVNKAGMVSAKFSPRFLIRRFAGAMFRQERAS